jgi:hypothetical protein
MLPDVAARKAFTPPFAVSYVLGSDAQKMPDAKRRTCARRPTRAAPRAWPIVVLAALSVTTFTGTLFAGAGLANLKGRVAGWDKLLPAVYVEASKADAHRYTWREPSPTVKQDFRRLSANVSRDVCVVALASGPSGRDHEPQAVKVTGGRFSPATIVLSTGWRLQFRNSDPFPHQLYEVGNQGWAPTATAPGSTRDWAAAAAGTHQIRDVLFPGMVMYVIVDEKAVDFAYPDRDGLFILNVPPGEYGVRAYFDGKPVSRLLEGVHVGDRGGEIRDTLTLGGGGESK